MEDLLGIIQVLLQKFEITEKWNSKIGNKVIRHDYFTKDIYVGVQMRIKFKPKRFI